VEFSKWDGTRHWHYEMLMLGEDAHGRWLGAPAGTPVQRGDEPAMPHPHGFVQLIPTGSWWTAIWNAGRQGRFEVYADIGTPAGWDGDVVRMVDLDLDVVRLRTGEVTVLDEDEFTEHRRRFGYPARVVDAARNAAARLVLAMESEREPFDAVGRSWLARLDEVAPG